VAPQQFGFPEQSCAGRSSGEISNKHAPPSAQAVATRRPPDEKKHEGQSPRAQWEGQWAAAGGFPKTCRAILAGGDELGASGLKRAWFTRAWCLTGKRARFPVGGFPDAGGLIIAGGYYIATIGAECREANGGRVMQCKALWFCGSTIWRVVVAARQEQAPIG